MCPIPNRFVERGWSAKGIQRETTTLQRDDLSCFVSNSKPSMNQLCFPFGYGIPGGRKETLYREKSFAYGRSTGLPSYLGISQVLGNWKVSRGVWNLSFETGERGFSSFRNWIHRSETIVVRNYCKPFKSKFWLERDSRSQAKDGQIEQRRSDRISIVPPRNYTGRRNETSDERESTSVSGRGWVTSEDIERELWCRFTSASWSREGLNRCSPWYRSSPCAWGPAVRIDERDQRKERLWKVPKAFWPIEPEEILRNLLRLDGSSSPSGFIGQPDSFRLDSFLTKRLAISLSLSLSFDSLCAHFVKRASIRGTTRGVTPPVTLLFNVKISRRPRLY